MPDIISTVIDRFAVLKQHHPVVFAVLVVPLLLMLANIAIRYLTSAQWAEFQAKNVRIAGLFKILKYAGIDVVGVLRSVVQTITGKLPDEPPAPPPAPPAAPPGEPPAAPPA